MTDFSRDVRRILREGGCNLVRQGKGDHEIWYERDIPGGWKDRLAPFRQRRSQGRGTPKGVLKRWRAAYGYEESERRAWPLPSIRSYRRFVFGVEACRILQIYWYGRC